jgi:aryl-alcohol dehydrogenase-like predicted oxidoreductase
MSFILGTANLLSNYGIDGITSALNESEAVRIFNEAQAYGVSRLDSAESYPKVEEFLGSTISNLHSYKVDSKVKINSKFTEKEFMNHVDMILSNLKLKKLNTLYLHNMDLLSDSNLELTTKCLFRVLNEGKADHVGVSVYTEQEIEFSLKQFPKFKSFQILENICDRRTLNSNYLSHLHESGIELNIRSIFLQGLLLCNLNLIPKHLSAVRQSLEEFQSFADKMSYTRFELCVAYAKQVPWASNIVIGVGTMSELIKIVSVDRPLPNEYKNYYFEIPTEFKDPRNWVL